MVIDMNISETRLLKIPYHKKFNENLIIEDGCELILSGIHLYALGDDDEIENEIAFITGKNLNNEKMIIPYTEEYKNRNYFLSGYRLIKGKVVTIEPEDIMDKVEQGDGGFTFIIKADE